MAATRTTTTCEVHYDPLSHAKRFHESKADETYLIGGYGAGKTTALVYEALRLAALNPGTTGMLTEPTYRMVHDVLMPVLLRELTKQRVPYHLHLSELAVSLPGRVTLLLRSRENAARLVGTTLSFAGSDEVCADRDEAAHRAILSRLRDGRANVVKMFGVGTPEGFNWFYRRYVENGVPDGVEIIHARTADNHWLHAGYKRRLVARLPKELLGAYLDGQFVPMATGRVFAGFDAKENVTETAYEPNVDLLWGHDFNVDPLCSVVVQRREQADGTSRFTVIDEIVLRGGATTADAAREFMRRYCPTHRANVVLYGDASGGKRDTRGSRSDFSILREVLTGTYEVEGKTKQGFESRRIVDRSNRVNPPLKESIQAMNALCLSGRNLRRLLINGQKARETLRSVLGCVYDGAGNLKKDGGEHLADALRYVCYREAPILRPRVEVASVEEAEKRVWRLAA